MKPPRIPSDQQLAAWLVSLPKWKVISFCAAWMFGVGYCTAKILNWIAP